MTHSFLALKAEPHARKFRATSDDDELQVFAGGGDPSLSLVSPVFGPPENIACRLEVGTVTFARDSDCAIT